MKGILSWERRHYVSRLGIFLIAVTLIAGMSGCGGGGPSGYDLIMAADPAAGGAATDETNGSPYDGGTTISIKADPNPGYEFAGWTALAGGFGDANAEETTFTMPSQDVTVTANFVAAMEMEIRDWYDFHAVRDNPSGNYVLMNDLDSTSAGYAELAGPAANGGKGWQPIGSLDYDTEELVDPFSGSFDGQGYDIRDVFINRPDEYGVALFGTVDVGGIIDNTGVVDCDVTGGGLASGLVGINWGGTVSSCYATGSITGTSDAFVVGGLVGANLGFLSECYAAGTVTGSDYVGGLAGASQGMVSNSYASSTVTGEWYIGGLVGANDGGDISNCYAIGGVIGDFQVGGLVGDNVLEATVSNSYSTGRVYGSDDVGGLVGHKYAEGIVADSFWDTESSGQATSSGGTGKTTVQMWDTATFTDSAWDVVEVAYGERDGAHTWNIVPGETYPFLSWEEPAEVTEIRTWHDLTAIRNNLAGRYVLMNDLDVASAGYEELAGTTANGGKGWEPIGSGEIDLYTGDLGFFDPFSGTFDGQGYEIRDLFIDRPDEEAVGLFGVVAGSVENVGVTNVALTGANGVGGLAGANVGSISSSYSSGSVSGNTGVGGLAGANGFGGMLSHCYSDAGVTGDIGVGGLVGGNAYEGTIGNSYSTGSVDGDEDAGGLVGFNYDSSVSNSYSTGSVTGASYVGGLVGENWGTVSDCFWDTQTSGQTTSDGGIGKTTAGMKSLSTFSDAAWDMTAVADSSTRNDSYIWNIVDGQTYPFLSWQLVS
jgi:uncharacterized repeat protein (TIGR02543 family)